MPNHPCDFEVPDEWLIEAGGESFLPTTPAYASPTDAVLVDLNAIEPPYRVAQVQKDWRGFDRIPLVSVFRGMALGAKFEPVPLRPLPEEDFPPAPYRFRVRDGFDRFYASIALGFVSIPAAVG